MIGHSKIIGIGKGQEIGRDRYGNPIMGPDIEETLYGEFFPNESSEPTEANRDLVVTRFRVILPARAQLTAYDKLRILGQDYNLIGQPMPLVMNGRIHHYEVVVERTTG